MFFNDLYVKNNAADVYRRHQYKFRDEHGPARCFSAFKLAYQCTDRLPRNYIQQSVNAVMSITFKFWLMTSPNDSLS
jgi:hypothetical protein